MTWTAALAAALETDVVRATPVMGGDINEAFRVELGGASRPLFVKTHRTPPEGLFAAEAAGLAWLRVGTLRVPEVVAVADQFLALEWLELTRSVTQPEVLGRGLASLHRAGGGPTIQPMRAIPDRACGLDHDNFLATLAQDNTPEPDIATFWIERRVRPLCTRAGLGVDRELDVLVRRRDRFGPAEPPARLHGDLWWGNVASCDGAPVLIDPAVYAGPREVDLAMLALFGGLPDRLIAGYHEVWPLAEGWRERLPLWQLYPLAAHAVLFGSGSYGASVRRILHALC